MSKSTKVDAAIKLAITSVTNANMAVQDALIAIAMHTVQHGDWTKINTLIGGLPDGIKKNSIQTWAENYLGVAYDKQAKEFTSWEADAAFIREHFDDAKKTLWYTLKPVNPPKVLDFDEALVKLVERTQKGLPTGKAVVKDEDLLRLIRLVSGGVISVDACLSLADTPSAEEAEVLALPAQAQAHPDDRYNTVA